MPFPTREIVFPQELQVTIPEGETLKVVNPVGEALKVASKDYLAYLAKHDTSKYYRNAAYIGTVSTSTPKLFSKETYNEQASGAQRSIASSNAGDSAVGAGIRSVCIKFIDGDGNDGEETIVLDGTTPVNTVSQNIKHINEIFAVSAGSNNAALGKITLYVGANGSGGQFCAISLGDQRFQIAQVFVPNGKTLIVHRLCISVEHAGSLYFYCTSGGLFRELVRKSVEVGSHSFSSLIVVPDGGKFALYYVIGRNNSLWTAVFEGEID